MPMAYAVRSADGATEVDADISRTVQSFEVREVMETRGRRESVSTLQLDQYGPVATSDPPTLARRSIVQVMRGGVVIEEYRVVQAVRSASADAPFSVTLEPRWMDLRAHLAADTTLAGAPRYAWSMVDVTPETALMRIMGAGAPAGFSAGTVDGSFGTLSVTLHISGVTHLDALRLLCEAVAEAAAAPCEWDVRYDSGSYLVDLVTSVGGTLNHPIDGPGQGTRATRRRAVRTLDATDYVSRVAPLGGPDGEIGTMAGASWEITAISGNDITLDGAPIYTAGQFDTPVPTVMITDGTNSAQVTRSTVPSGSRCRVRRHSTWATG